MHGQPQQRPPLTQGAKQRAVRQQRAEAFVDQHPRHALAGHQAHQRVERHRARAGLRRRRLCRRRCGVVAVLAGAGAGAGGAELPAVRRRRLPEGQHWPPERRRALAAGAISACRADQRLALDPSPAAAGRGAAGPLVGAPAVVRGTGRRPLPRIARRYRRTFLRAAGAGLSQPAVARPGRAGRRGLPARRGADRRTAGARAAAGGLCPGLFAQRPAGRRLAAAQRPRGGRRVGTWWYANCACHAPWWRCWPARRWEWPAR